MNFDLHTLAEVGEFVAGIGGIATLIILIFQIIDLKKTVRGQTYQAVYSEMLRLDRFFFDNSNFREHFYEGKELPTDPQTQLQAKIVAEMICDFSDNIYLQKPTIHPEQFKEWLEYIKFLHQNSPILEEAVKSRESWYDPEYRKRMLEPRKRMYTKLNGVSHL